MEMETDYVAVADVVVNKFKIAISLMGPTRTGTSRSEKKGYWRWLFSSGREVQERQELFLEEENVVQEVASRLQIVEKLIRLFSSKKSRITYLKKNLPWKWRQIMWLWRPEKKWVRPELALVAGEEKLPEVADVAVLRDSQLDCRKISNFFIWGIITVVKVLNSHFSVLLYTLHTGTRTDIGVRNEAQLFKPKLTDGEATKVQGRFSTPNQQTSGRTLSRLSQNADNPTIVDPKGKAKISPSGLAPPTIMRAPGR
ncbi:hypothetical protein Fot_37299 [Forsythia ovata]|uniref:Uncharacterized protein n=1 Tax=Forsythia ovata TaxID=205694 RepID=A0ABD1RYL6_9LAMI